jgi:prephenate dehydrogenase
MHISSVGIIGFGSFGEFIFNIAKERFPEVAVKVYSSRREPDGTDFYTLADVCTTDLLFVCVPIAAFAATIDRIVPLLGAHTIVCDVATVKKHTVEVLKSKNVSRYLATHPMFGPYSYEKHGKSLTGLRIAVCDTTIPTEEFETAINFLRLAKLKVLELTADEHDKLIAETLFLTHLIGQTVTKGGFKRTSIDTVSFGFLMDAVESVAHDEALFRDVYTYNPYCTEVLARYEEAKKQIVSSLTQSKA